MAEPSPKRADPPQRWQPSAFVRLTAGVHAVGLAALAVAPHRWPLVGAALLVNHAFLAVGGFWPRSRLLGANIVRLDTDAPELALTFDDGPDPQVTPRVLDLLDGHGAKATFFCIGRHADAHPAIVSEIHSRGHAVANHTYTHPNSFTMYGPAAIEREVRRTQEAVARAGVPEPVLFRAPVGMRNPWVDPVLSKAGLRLVSWTRRGFDTVSRDPARVTARLAAGVKAGAILLLHDRATSRTPSGQPMVLDVLPRLLDTIAARGLRSVAMG